MLQIRVRMDPELFIWIRIQRKVKEQINKTVNSRLFFSVVDPGHFVADPDHTFQADADADPTFF